MSDAPKCEPPEELRGVDGEHQIYHHANDGPQGNPVTARWGARYQGWWADWIDLRGHNAGEAASMGWRYAGPVLTPTEAANLRAERDAAVAEVARLRALLDEIEADAFWARSHAALRAKITAALNPEPSP